ncbi:hypothetical protein CVT26_006480 [Gymnopilus dilepis]|uniref:Uncharacterized protein n=1 Tax=Gymnopilus dilepis TaxID=231916 RepID=A0A409W6F7_9AGAR|nr:hypothetical protein CVT26_006480 [Gymnopilus dilepis]
MVLVFFEVLRESLTAMRTGLSTLLPSALTALTLVNITLADVVHYPPAATNINNISFVFNGTGAPGIFTSSDTPDSEYGVYNWCNMPHVRQREYKTPPRAYTLEYVEVIQRHHKRTPYSSNTFFKEDVSWSCDGSGATFGMIRQVLVALTFVDPLTSGYIARVVLEQVYRQYSGKHLRTLKIRGFQHCQFPQITSEGLQDSITHGSDLRAVYASRLGLPAKLDPTTTKIRVTNNVITSQVASGLVAGLFPLSEPHDIAVMIQSSNFDSLEPAYSCGAASRLISDYTTGSDGAQWQAHLTEAAPLYSKLDKVSGIATQDSGGWHVSFDHYYDNLSAKQCHGKALPCSVNDTSLCITQEEANTVYRLGNWEYSYQFRDAPQSAQYSAFRYGVWALELESHLQAKVDGTSQVAHDGSISPLLGLLQIDQMVWPGISDRLPSGAQRHVGRKAFIGNRLTQHLLQVVFELYSTGGRSKSFFIRVLWGGQPMKTSTPLGILDMIPLSKFLAYIDTMVGGGSDLFTACTQ